MYFLPEQRKQGKYEKIPHVRPHWFWYLLHRETHELMAMEQLATGVATGIATNKTIQTLDELQKDPNDLSEKQILLQIRDALVPTEKQNLNFPMALQPYPSEYVIDEEWFLRAHVCIFFGTSTPIRFDIEGIGTYLKTCGPGWVQCDVRGRLSTTDSLNHNVIVSYRVDPVGGFL